VDGAFDLDYAGKERSQMDWGLSQAPGDPEDDMPPVPSLIIQSCWAIEYPQAFSDMQEWMKQGGGAVQVVILLKWSIVVKDPSDPIYILEGEIEVFKYSAEAPAKYQKARHEVIHLFHNFKHATLLTIELQKLTSADREDYELQALNITAGQLFGGEDPHGEGPSYDLSFSDLWNIALDIFESEVEEHLQPQPSSNRPAEKGAPVDDGSLGKDTADESDMSDGEGVESTTIVVGGGGNEKQITTEAVIECSTTVKTSVVSITITEHSFEASHTATCTGSDVMSGESPERTLS